MMNWGSFALGFLAGIIIGAALMLSLAAKVAAHALIDLLDQGERDVRPRWLR